eukprot:scaffold24022_cov168-Amphora_coffeaeformis.AAC.2
MVFAPVVAFASTKGSLTVAKAAGTTTLFFLPHNLPPHGLVTTTTTSLGSSLYEGAGKLMDYSEAASSFFTSIRIPAALIAGSSLATMFTDPEAVNDNASPMQNRIMVLYHLAALISFLLSINVVITATTTSTRLLLGMKNPVAHSAYELLRREMEFQFTSTRWSFFMSIFSFLISVTGRMLLEFKLLERRRFRMATMLTSAVLSLMFHILSLANRALKSWPNMGAMTLDLTKKLWMQSGKYPMEAASFTCMTAAIFMGTWACVKTRGFSRLDFDEVSDNDNENDKEEDDSFDEFVREISSREDFCLHDLCLRYPRVSSGIGLRGCRRTGGRLSGKARLQNIQHEGENGKFRTVFEQRIGIPPGVRKDLVDRSIFMPIENEQGRKGGF